MVDGGPGWAFPSPVVLRFAGEVVRPINIPIDEKRSATCDVMLYLCKITHFHPKILLIFTIKKIVIQCSSGVEH
jgi:hypothetical protein